MTGESGTAAGPVMNLGTVLDSGARHPRLHAGEAAAQSAAIPARGQAKVRRNVRSSAPVASLDELLPHGLLLAQLHRERRRVDRSKAPLSLIIYRMAQRSDESSTAELATLLVANKRETDIAGWLGTDVLAVICPDTGNEGVHRFITKIDAISGDLCYSVECATYPDQLFEGLSASPALAHGPSPLLGEKRALSTDPSYLLKRPLDIVGALLAIVLFAPLMLVAALAVKLTSRGPVIFKQTRLGKSGVPFVFYKFRSMRADNDDRIHRDYVKVLISGDNASANQQDSSTPLYTIKDDPRVTRVGRFIRRTSIDELPQLFNVLKGDMSLVGPRPPLPYEAENYRSWHLRRVLDIKPGMTGLWQVEGRSKVTFDEMVRMDLRYIRGCSLPMDLRILAETFFVVLSCEGAS